VPAIVISPFARRHYVDHTTYDTTSILAFIEKRFGLQPLTSRDAAASPLMGAFDFDNAG
jgi:phospholipase C